MLIQTSGGSDPRASTTFDEVYDLFIRQGKTRGEIRDLMGHRISLTTIRDYISRAINEAKAKGDSVPMRSKHGGGFKPLTDSKSLSSIHATIGIKVSRYRETVMKQTCKEFCAAFSFGSWIRLRQIENGVHDLSLREVQRIAEILNMSVQDLVTPLGSAYASHRS